MEFLPGEKLIRKNKQEIVSEEALKNKEIVAFYFSAHWCPPCKRFTPMLAIAYEELLEEKAPFEVIFVSADQTAEGLFSYMEESHGNWLAIPFGSDLLGKLKKKFNVEGIPALVVVRKDGSLITENGRNDVERKGAAAYKDWKSKQRTSNS